MDEHVTSKWLTNFTAAVLFEILGTEAVDIYIDDWDKEVCPNGRWAHIIPGPAESTGDASRGRTTESATDKQPDIVVVSRDRPTEVHSIIEVEKPPRNTHGHIEGDISPILSGDKILVSRRLSDDGVRIPQWKRTREPLEVTGRTRLVVLVYSANPRMEWACNKARNTVCAVGTSGGPNAEKIGQIVIGTFANEANLRDQMRAIVCRPINPAERCIVALGDIFDGPGDQVTKYPRVRAFMREWLRQKNLSDAAVAEMVGIKYDSLHSIVYGKIRHSDYLRTLADSEEVCFPIVDYLIHGARDLRESDIVAYLRSHPVKY